MKVDKFGIAALLVGLILLAGVLHFGFMEGGNWSVQGIINAISTAVVGGLIILAVILIIIGILLLVL